MLHSENALASINNILSHLPFKYFFKIHGCFRYPVYRNWKNDLQNYHDLHILYVWDGEGIYKMCDGSHLPLNKGSLVFISHNYMHTAEVNRNNPVKIQGLRFGIYDKLGCDSIREIIQPCYFHMKVTNMQYTDHMTHKIHQLFHTENIPYSDTTCSSILYQLFSDMHLALTGIHYTKTFDSRIKSIKDSLDSDPFTSVSVSELSAKMNMSVRYLQILFKRETGYTPKEYVLNLRMNIAHSYLENENIRIKEVADLLGYSDQYTFSRQFHKFFGYTPSSIKRVF